MTAEKRIKEELKAEIAGVKAELKSEIAGVETQLRTEIAQSEERVKIYVDTKFEGFDKRLTLVVGFVSALIILIVVTVGIPQVIMAWRGKNERAHERRIEELAQK